MKRVVTLEDPNTLFRNVAITTGKGVCVDVLSPFEFNSSLQCTKVNPWISSFEYIFLEDIIHDITVIITSLVP